MNKKLCYIRWLDAVTEEAGEDSKAIASLCELEEVGWLLDETEEAILISMETESHSLEEMKPGRWRLHIPKSGILEMHTREFGKIFNKKTKKI